MNRCNSLLTRDIKALLKQKTDSVLKSGGQKWILWPRDFVGNVMAVRSLKSLTSQSLCIGWFHPLDLGKVVHVISWDLYPAGNKFLSSLIILALIMMLLC